MAPLPSPEPFELLDTVEVVDARKLRFERNRIKLPMGVEATFGMTVSYTHLTLPTM